MLVILSRLQSVDIEDKIQNAPDKGYEIGVFIGSMLPFVVLVVIAYVIYNYSKNRKFNNTDEDT